MFTFDSPPQQLHDTAFFSSGEEKKMAIQCPGAPRKPFRRENKPLSCFPTRRLNFEQDEKQENSQSCIHKVHSKSYFVG